MKHIVKGSEPEALIEWKALASEDWQPTYADLSGNVKLAVMTSLMQEQGGICCYCERELHDNDRHIEHFKPQSDDAVDPLDYSNMICSCQKQIKKGEPRHCGNLKGNWFDAEQLVSPLSPDCAGRFEYAADGYIVAVAGNSAASETIKKLGLDLDKLNWLRNQAIEPFLDPMLTDEELIAFISGYLEKKDGRYNSFFTTIKFLFG